MSMNFNNACTAGGSGDSMNNATMELMLQQQMARLRSMEAGGSSSSISAPPSNMNMNMHMHMNMNMNDQSSKKWLDWSPSMGYQSAAAPAPVAGNNDSLLGMAASLFGVDSYAAAAVSASRGLNVHDGGSDLSNNVNSSSNVNSSNNVSSNDNVLGGYYQQQQQQQQLAGYGLSSQHQRQYHQQHQHASMPMNSFQNSNNCNNSTINNLLTPQQQLARSVDITSKVLSELPSDMFGEDLFNVDLFDQTELEPLPIDPRRINIIKTGDDAQRQHQRQSSLAVLEETINVLNQDVDLDIFHPNTSSSTSRHCGIQQQQQQQPFVVPSSINVSSSKTNNNNNNLKRPPTDSSSNSNTATTTKRPTKKQRNNTSSNNNNNNEPDDEDQRRFRPYQSEQWAEKFDELLAFKKQRGHCCVPHTFDENPALARWVKRQRYQYKLMNESKQSTMTAERVVTLENVGFIWDSHSAAWYDRLNELKLYKASHSNCNVPSNYPANPQLATWIKCQRRQYKLFFDGKTSNMTLERIQELELLGFEWELRSHTKNKLKTASVNSTTNANTTRSLDHNAIQQQQQHMMFLAPSAGAGPTDVTSWSS